MEPMTLPGFLPTLENPPGSPGTPGSAHGSSAGEQELLPASGPCVL